MDNKIVKTILKIVRLLLPAAAFFLCTCADSYRIPIKETESSPVVGHISTNFFDQRIMEYGNWMPIIFVLLCIAAIAMALVCIFKETEKTLTWLANALCLAMVADLATLIFMDLTPISWGIAGLLGAGVALTAFQEIQLEKKNNK